MSTPLEQYRYKGPSKLTERLEVYRDLETGHRMISQEDAAKELLRSLLAYYRKNETRVFDPEIFPNPQTDSKIEALAAIVQGDFPASKEGPLYDFDLIKEIIDLRREEEEARLSESERRRRDALNSIHPFPHQPEI